MAEKPLKSIRFPGSEDVYKLKPDWENIDNKPFNSSTSDTITMDQITESELEALAASGELIADNFIHVSDVVLTMDDLIKNGLSVTIDSTTAECTTPEEVANAAIELTEGFLIIFDGVFVSIGESMAGVDIEGLMFPKKGLYIHAMFLTTTSVSITVPGFYLVRSEKLNIDCLPDHLQFGDFPTGGDTLTWDGNTDGRHVFSSETNIPGVEVTTINFCYISNVFVALDYIVDNKGMRLVIDDMIVEGDALHESIQYKDDGYINIGLSLIVVPYDEYTLSDSAGEITFPYTGIYFMYTDSSAPTNVSLTVPGFAGFPSTKKLDMKYLPESHQFGEVNGDTFTWDGNTDGKIGVPELGVYLISNKPFSSNDVENGMKVTVYYKQHNAEQSHELRDYEIYINSDGFITDESVFSVPYDNYVATDLGGIVFPNAGIYALNTGDIYVSSITIPGCTDFIVTKPLDAKYLPESISKPTVLYVDTYTWLCRTSDGDDESNRITKNELMDIVKNSIAIQICQYEVDDTYIKYVTNVHFNAYKDYGEVAAGYNGDKYYTSEYIPMED